MLGGCLSVDFLKRKFPGRQIEPRDLNRLQHFLKQATTTKVMSYNF